MTVAILLIDPKYPHNVGAVVRAASVLGAGVVGFTGDRVSLVGGRKEARLPREERLRDYQHVQLKRVDQRSVFDKMRGTPVAVEVMPDAEPLPLFEHPEDAVYVFGPEDGSLNRSVLGLCHHHVRIPTTHCMNLGAAVNVVLYDRLTKEHHDSPEWFYQPDLWRPDDLDALDTDRTIEALMGIQ